MIAPGIWALATLLAHSPQHINVSPAGPIVQASPWVLLTGVAGQIFTWKFPTKRACISGLIELKQIVPEAVYICYPE